MENPIKIDDLGVPLFLDTPICSMYIQLHLPLKMAVSYSSTPAMESCVRCLAVSPHSPLEELETQKSHLKSEKGLEILFGFDGVKVNNPSEVGNLTTNH